MNKKIFIRVVIAILLIVFTAGSIFYFPKSKKNEVIEQSQIEVTDGSKDVKQVLSAQEFRKHLIDKKMTLNWADYIVVALYAIIIVGLGLFASRVKKGHERNSEDYFLAGKSLPWWAIGSSLIAANISAEQFVGMSGSGFAIGLSIATYEWMAALTLIVVGKFFLPIFIKQGIYTIPEFVEKRYNKNLKTILSVFWLCLFVFVNLTSVLYLGAKAMETITGLPLMYGILILSFFAAAYSLWGGLSAVAWTDVVQVIFLIFGGIFTSVIAVRAVGGFGEMISVVPEKFQMILSSGDINFSSLPGIGVLIGGMWVANLYYWGFNQYIIQRTFAAKSLKEAQKGIAFAAILKLIIPFIVVIPGIAAYILWHRGELSMQLGSTGNIVNDTAYPSLLGFLPNGIRGVAFAALIAAIVSSLASMLNSIATIWTMDIYKVYIKKDASARHTVNVGRISAIVALLIAILIAPQLASLGQAFQFIQEYTGLVSPPILAIFLLGLFWKKATSNASIFGVTLGTVFGLLLKILVKISEGTVANLENSSTFLGKIASVLAGFPFMHQMGLTCVFTMGVIVIASLIENKMKNRDIDDKAIITDENTFKTGTIFNLLAFAIILVLVGLYTIFWNTNMVKRVFCFKNKSAVEAVVDTVKEKVEEIKVEKSLFPEYVVVKDVERGKLLKFSPEVRYEFATSNLSDNIKNTLKVISVALIEKPDLKVVVEGHTGNKGYAYPNNYKLAVERVKKAKEFLVNSGVNSDQIIESPLGEFLPEYERQEDLRRLEYVVIENSDDMLKYEDFLTTVDVRKEAK